MIIYLIRHGETNWNKEGKLQGQSDILLNDYGKKLASITAAGLKDVAFEAVYSSPLIRAKETAEIIRGNRDIPIYEDSRLKEMSFGIEEGGDIKKIKEDPADPLHSFLFYPESFIPPDNGESFADLYGRSKEFMEEVLIPLEEKRQYETLLLVAHGAFNRSMLNQIAGIPIENFWKISLKNCAVSILSLKDGVFRILEEGKLFYEP